MVRNGHPALFRAPKIWKQPKGPLMDEWIKKMWYMDTIWCYSAFKKKDTLPFVITCMDLEDIMLNKISQTQRDK